VAIRVANLKPGAVVLHGLTGSKVDPIARQIAEIERLPLMTTDMPVEEMIEALRK
jgi:putative transcriptional regulator